MPKIDLVELQSRVASMTGMANPDSLSKILPGAIFEIDDALIRFPGDAPRTWHDFRRVIVVQSYMFLGPTEPETVSVVPCSASQVNVRRCDLLIPDGEPGFTKPFVVAYARLLMPVLKTALTIGGYRGELRPETYGKLLARIAANLGIGPSISFPPR